MSDDFATFVTNVAMPEDLGEDMTIANHGGMRSTLKIEFNGCFFQYHMDTQSLKIPSSRGASWINGLDWGDALKLVRVLTHAVGGKVQ